MTTIELRSPAKTARFMKAALCGLALSGVFLSSVPPLKAGEAFPIKDRGGLTDNAPGPVPDQLSSVFILGDDGQGAIYQSYVAALVAQADKDAGKAAHYFKSAVEADPANDHVLIRAFYQLLFAGHVQDAADVASRITALPETEQFQDNLTYQLSVLDHIGAGRYDMAVTRLKEWGSFNNRNMVLGLMIAWATAASGDTDAALAMLDKIANGEDAYAAMLASEHAAYVADSSGNIFETERRYRALVESRRVTSLQPFVQYAAFVKRTKGDAIARELVEDYRGRFKKNSYVRRETDRILAGYGASHDARDINEALAMLFFRLGNELSNGKAKQAAIVYLQMADFLRAGSGDTLVLLATLLEEQKDHRGAALAYGRVPEADPLFGLASLRYVESLRMAGDSDGLSVALDKALKQNPKSVEFNTMQADLAREAGDFKEALNRYDRVIKQLEAQNRATWYPYFARGVVADELGDWAAAETDFLKALELNTEQATVQNYLGYRWIDRGENMDQGQALIQKALAQEPEDGFINDSLGWVYFLTGDYPAAVLYLEQAVRYEAGDATIHHHLGDAYWQVGREREARFQWRHALDSKPDDEEERQALTRKLRNGLTAADLKQKSKAKG